jgi:hypothetical protein
VTALGHRAGAPAVRPAPSAVAGPDLTFELCDPACEEAPAGWAECIREHALHVLWDWRVVHAVTAERGGGVVAGMFKDGSRVVGLGTARLHTLGRRHAVGGAADVTHPAYGALPGICLAGGLPRTLHDDGPAPELLDVAVRALETSLRREFGRRLQAIMYRQVYAGELPVFERGTTLTRAGKPVGVLNTRFADYDDYLRTLTRSRRQDQRRLARLIEADPSLTVRFAPTADSGIDLDEFCALSADVARRNHRERWPLLRIWSPRLFHTVVTLPDVHVLSYTEDSGRLVAASALFDHPVAPVLGPWGAPPLGEGRRSGLWFDHIGREIRWSIERGRRLVIAGKGAGDAKQALGFVMEPQWTVLRRLSR